MMPYDVKPACVDRLDLVDATFDRGKKAKDAARRLASLCRSCPVAEACLREQMTHPSPFGVWGGVRRSFDSSRRAGRLKVVA